MIMAGHWVVTFDNGWLRVVLDGYGWLWMIIYGYGVVTAGFGWLWGGRGLLRVVVGY